MSAYKSDFLRILAERGFIHQISDAEGLDAKAMAGPITAYVGFDATAPSLHIGNLLTIMMLRWLQKSGHHPIALMGGGTSKIGDPSGKDTTRTLLSDAQIESNIASIRNVFARFLDFGAGAGAVMANNAEWLDQLHRVAGIAAGRSARGPRGKSDRGHARPGTGLRKRCHGVPFANPKSLQADAAIPAGHGFHLFGL